jgi:membrane protein DedA with SNARE-associated domain
MLRDVLFHFLKNFHGPAAYVGVLFVLVLCGLGVPLPEDVPLISGGWLVGRGGFPTLMIFVGLAGILIGDSIIFKAGQTYGERLLDTRVGRHIPRHRVERTIALFARHGAKFIMVARFVPGLRAVTYFVAGTTGVPYWKFITFDGLAACVSAPLWVILGWYARKHNMLTRAWAWASKAQMLLLAVIAGLVAIWLIINALVRKHRRARGIPPTDPGLRPVSTVVDLERERPAARRR